MLQQQPRSISSHHRRAKLQRSQPIRKCEHPKTHKLLEIQKAGSRQSRKKTKSTSKSLPPSTSTGVAATSTELAAKNGENTQSKQRAERAERSAERKSARKDKAQEATLRVLVLPWGKVQVGGGASRNSPGDFTLKPGKHTIRYGMTGLTKKKTISLRSGESKRLVVQGR